MKHTKFYVLVFFFIFALIMQPTVAFAVAPATWILAGAGGVGGAALVALSPDATGIGIISVAIVGIGVGFLIGFGIESLIFYFSHEDEPGDVRIANDNVDNGNAEVSPLSIDISSFVDIELVSPLSFQ